jgi:hypothetical protein
MVPRIHGRRLLPGTDPAGGNTARNMNEINIKSVEDARKYREELAARKPEDDPGLAKWRTSKRYILLLLVVVFFLMYYLISVNIEVLSLPGLNVTVGVPKP